MTSPIVLSHNELQALLNRYCEAAFAHHRDFYDAAKLVCWMEARGLGGIDLLLNAKSLKAGNVAIRRVDAGNPLVSQYVCDLSESSGLCGLLSVVDLVIGEAKSDGHSQRVTRVDIENCDCLPLMLPMIASCHASDVFCEAVWIGLHEDSVMIASPSDMTPEPNVFAGQAPSQNPLKKGDAVLVGAPTRDLVVNYLDREPWLVSARKNLQPTFTGLDLSIRFRDCIDNGIPIDSGDYKRLCAFADRILVEASEASRKGAGE